MPQEQKPQQRNYTEDEVIKLLEAYSFLRILEMGMRKTSSVNATGYAKTLLDDKIPEFKEMAPKELQKKLNIKSLEEHCRITIKIMESIYNSGCF